MKQYILASCIACMSSLVVADEFDGSYRGSGEGRLLLRIKSNYLNMKTSQGNFSGEIEGTYEKIDSNRLKIKSKNDVGTCELTLHFTQNRKTVEVTEGECEGFHGAGTGFDGKLKKIR